MKRKHFKNRIRIIVAILTAPILTVTLLLQVPGKPVFADVADDAESYCLAVGNPVGSSAYFSCIQAKQAELAECDDDPQPASRAACRENALTYGETGIEWPEGSANDNFDESKVPNGDFTCENATIKVDCVEADNEILSYMGGVINFLAAGVGVIVALMVVIGGVQYMYSRGNPQAVEAAKKRIANALIALGVYLFAFAFLQWLIPGGLF